MSSVEIVKRSYDAFARKDLAGVMGDMDPEIEWQQAQGLPHGGTYHGLDEVRRNIFDPLDVNGGMSSLPSPTSSSMPATRWSCSAATAGSPRRPASTSTFRSSTSGRSAESKAVRFRQFLDTAGWVEALGH